MLVDLWQFRQCVIPPGFINMLAGVPPISKTVSLRIQKLVEFIHSTQHQMHQLLQLLILESSKHRHTLLQMNIEVMLPYMSLDYVRIVSELCVNQQAVTVGEHHSAVQVE